MCSRTRAPVPCFAVSVNTEIELLVRPQSDDSVESMVDPNMRLSFGVLEKLLGVGLYVVN